jgi:hypothetical protein
LAALVRFPDGETRRIGLGADLGSGLTVVDIHPDRVLVTRAAQPPVALPGAVGGGPER